MCFIRFMLLFTIMLSTMPKINSYKLSSNTFEQGSHSIMIDHEEPEEQEDEGEELAA
jgi:hypothetical protein